MIGLKRAICTAGVASLSHAIIKQPSAVYNHHLACSFTARQRKADQPHTHMHAALITSCMQQTTSSAVQHLQFPTGLEATSHKATATAGHTTRSAIVPVVQRPQEVGVVQAAHLMTNAVQQLAHLAGHTSRRHIISLGTHKDMRRNTQLSATTLSYTHLHATITLYIVAKRASKQCMPLWAQQPTAMPCP